MKKLIIVLSVIDLLIIGFSKLGLNTDFIRYFDNIVIMAIVMNVIVIACLNTRRLLIAITIATISQFIYCITAVNDFGEEWGGYQWRFNHFVPDSIRFSDNISRFLENCYLTCLLLVVFMQLIILGWALYIVFKKPKVHLLTNE